nr:MAG TPA: hypothetical protein [Caudoviricetes sp.]
MRSSAFRKPAGIKPKACRPEREWDIRRGRKTI